MRETGRPLDGRSCSLRVYRLCTRVEWVPQLGHEAVGDVVRSVSVISVATRTCSTSTSKWSGKMMRACKVYLEERERWEKVQPLSISHLGSARLKPHAPQAHHSA